MTFQLDATGVWWSVSAHLGRVPAGYRRNFLRAWKHRRRWRELLFRVKVRW